MASLAAIHLLALTTFSPVVSSSTLNLALLEHFYGLMSKHSRTADLDEPAELGWL